MAAEFKVKLKSSDNEIFEVDKAVAFQSHTIKNLVEDTGAYDPVPLPNVSGRILAKVIEYCKYHAEEAANSVIWGYDVKAWDREFFNVDQATRYDLYSAANYLNIKSLVDLTCKVVRLKSNDGVMFEVSKAVAFQSQTIKNLVEDTGTYNPVPLPNVSSKILAKVIEYCEYHVVEAVKSAVGEDDVKAWDQEFVKVDQGMLFDFILAANYLNIKNFLALTCQTVADMIKGKTPEEIRNTFNISNHFTAEEEEEIRRENQWAFE